MKTLNKKLTQIQCELKAKKSSYNSFGKYYFRKAESILESLKPFLLKHEVSVTISEELITWNDSVPVIKSTATISDGEFAIHADAIVGVDLQQKGMQTSQQFGAASSYAKKYSLGNLFLLDDSEDSDSSNTHGKEAVAKQWMTPDQMTKATSFLKSGGSLSSIKEKYSMTKAMEAELLKIK